MFPGLTGPGVPVMTQRITPAGMPCGPGGGDFVCFSEPAQSASARSGPSAENYTDRNFIHIVYSGVVKPDGLTGFAAGSTSFAAGMDRVPGKLV